MFELEKYSMSIKKRLQEFAEHINISPSEFERSIGASNGWLSKDGDAIRGERLERLFKEYPMLNSDWLMTGKGEMIIQTDEINKSCDVEINSNNSLTIQAILKLVESNKALSDAALRQSEANIVQARSNENLTYSNKELTNILKSSIADADLKNQAVLDKKISHSLLAVADFLAENYKGKSNFDSRSIYQVMHKHVFSTEMDISLKNTLDEADRSNKSN